MKVYKGASWWRDGALIDFVVDQSKVLGREPHDPNRTGEDVSGKVLLPAFHDNHCHILPTGLDLLKLDLRPFQTESEVLDALRDRESVLAEDEWLLAVGYDQTRFSSSQHITRHDLDLVSKSRPILLRHVSGHASVANSAALKSAGISSNVEDPVGGTFERDSTGQLTGVLLENAHEFVTAASPKITPQQMLEAILLASGSMAQYGIVCASDMMTGRFDLAEELRAYTQASLSSGVRYRLYVQWRDVFGSRAIDPELFQSLVGNMSADRCRVAGIKIFADGAIGARTAAIYGQYEGSGSTDDEGTLMYAPERLRHMVQVASDAGYQVSVHAIGDRATDHVLDAFESTGDPSRHRLEHAMILSDQQIERIAKLGCHVTMQPEFLIRFGHAYLKQLGPIRAAKLKRMRSIRDAGIRLSLDSDRPIVAGDPRDGILAATNRPIGFDPSENLTLTEAIEGYTRFAAESTGDGGKFGTLEPGENAEFKLMDQSEFDALRANSSSA